MLDRAINRGLAQGELINFCLEPNLEKSVEELARQKIEALQGKAHLAAEATSKKEKQPNATSTWETIGGGLYRQGNRIYVRPTINGKKKWLTTGTNDPALARLWFEKWKRERWLSQHGIRESDL
jgi:hypothetical protein